ncbi:hypothetical protein AJ78_01762 [Emergomyces pasteurianus Ep9510]|uniref:Uncharacterized protein n=1 Tax=Emergomyces pasteurianus Ep9510 TaxID=1447872 RepID=A0A1J9QQR6_9EURO|nr:hypothetical protein AJ78_01762 [Emergomyces pasteurianus Ep9510]
MVSRASSSAVSTLKRAKSTSSVKSCRHIPPVPELINPQTVNHHAMAAASIAMKRSNHRSSMDLRGSCNASRSGESEADRFSFRSSKARSIHFTTGENVGAQSQRPFIKCPSSITSPSGHETVRNDPAFNAAVEELTPRMSEFSGIGDSISSAPSSYRKLRKAKSMFSTRKRAMKSSDSSYSPFRSYGDSESPEMGHLSRATLRRSKSFFGTETAKPPEDTKRIQNQKAAVQLAREQYLQELQLPKQNNRSGYAQSRRGRTQSKPFRKSLRISSGWGAENTIPFDTQPMDTGVTHPSKDLRSSRSRIFSVSIKNGLKRIFGRGSVVAQEEIYSSKGQRTHPLGFSDYVNSDSTEPSSHANRPASIRTLRSSDSFGTFSSRATSWTDSTTTNTVAARNAVSERNDLSVIQENGGLPEPIRSPSSFHYNDGYSVFRKPLYTGRGQNSAYDVVDSQRVYSALVRHIDESHHHDGDITPRARTVRRSIYSPSSSVYSHRTSDTIRHVPSEASMRTIRALHMVRSESPSSRSQVSAGSNYHREPLPVTPQEIAQRIENMSRHRSMQSLHQSGSSPRFQLRGQIPNPLIPPRFSSYEQVMSSEDDTESVIISRPDVSGRSAVSPSVYSRTTSGDTPRQYGSRRDLTFSESSDERGTATILTSERLPYKPKDTGGYVCSDRQIKGSADWKSWMSSQMDLLDPTPENFAMTQYDKIPNTHYREKTEIHDEQTDGTTGETHATPQATGNSAGSPQGPSSLDVGQRPPLLELKSFTQHNFSRPTRLPPDIPISISCTSVQKPSVVARSESPHSVHINPTVNPEPSTPADSTLPLRASGSPSASPLVYEKSRRPDITIEPVTPTRVPKTVQSNISLRTQSEKDSQTGRISDPRKSAPTINFSSVRNSRDNGRATNENSRGSRVNTKNDLRALGDIHSTISSKRMVDIFLSQRRRQMGGVEKPTENAFI